MGAAGYHKMALDAEERLERHERVATAGRLRYVLVWWWSERRTGGDRRCARL